MNYSRFFFTFILIQLIVLPGLAQLETKQYEAFTFCKGKQLKPHHQWDEEIQIDRKVLKDSVWYNLHYDVMTTFDGSSLMASFNNIYYFVEPSIPPVYIKFMDLSAEAGSSILVTGGYFNRDTVILFLRNRIFSIALNDTLYFYEIFGESEMSHRGFLDSFVFSKRYGFLRYGYYLPLITRALVKPERAQSELDGCMLVFYPRKFCAKWQQSKDAALLKLFTPSPDDPTQFSQDPSFIRY